MFSIDGVSVTIFIPPQVKRDVCTADSGLVPEIETTLTCIKLDYSDF